jgi:hypothetical protein
MKTTVKSERYTKKNASLPCSEEKLDKQTYKASISLGVGSDSFLFIFLLKEISVLSYGSPFLFFWKSKMHHHSMFKV